MAGETVKSEAICLSISPWSMTSHVVNWLTPAGIVPTVVKGAARPKSAFLGQYDLNYTCEIVYYARARGELHALRECSALERRDELRDDYRSLAAAGYLRLLASRLSPQGPECAAWHGLLSDALDRLCECSAGRVDVVQRHVASEDVGRFHEANPQEAAKRDHGKEVADAEPCLIGDHLIRMS